MLLLYFIIILSFNKIKVKKFDFSLSNIEDGVEQLKIKFDISNKVIKILSEKTSFGNFEKKIDKQLKKLFFIDSNIEDSLFS